MFNGGVGHLVHWHKDPDEHGDHVDHDQGPLLESNSDLFVRLEPYSEIFEK